MTLREQVVRSHERLTVAEGRLDRASEVVTGLRSRLRSVEQATEDGRATHAATYAATQAQYTALERRLEARVVELERAMARQDERLLRLGQLVQRLLVHVPLARLDTEQETPATGAGR